MCHVGKVYTGKSLTSVGKKKKEKEKGKKKRPSTGNTWYNTQQELTQKLMPYI